LNVARELWEGVRGNEVAGEVVEVDEDFVFVAHCRTQVVIAWGEKIIKLAYVCKTIFFI
jgi:hypothetical protein